MRQEKYTESQIVPLPTSGPPQPDTRESETKQWLHGRIEVWKADRGFGFIKSDDESFWFNPDYLFDAGMNPTEGARVIFTPLPPLPNAKSRRASAVFVEGSKLQGAVNRVLKGKGCAFATVNGQGGQTHSIFLETGDDPSVVVGATVEFTTGENPRGPTGFNVKVIGNPSG